MKPQIDFTHVLRELSVNRTDPCEIVRELISNSYDAKSTKIRYAAIESLKGFIYWDNGDGLCTTTQSNEITPWEAFFSIGKSTKIKGESIGYKCQGSKLCFASSRILVLSKTKSKDEWHFLIKENPRQTLNPESEILPTFTKDPANTLSKFVGTSSADGTNVLNLFNEDFFEGEFESGTLIAIQGLDIENFTRYLLGSSPTLDSYLANYIRLATKHGDTRLISTDQGFKPNHVKQVNSGIKECTFEIFDGKSFIDIPAGFPYLNTSSDIDIKSPNNIARLRDGRFSARHAKRFKYGNNSYCLILAVDGNRKAHDGYMTLDRKGAAKSGLRLSDQRGVAISVNGIKVCKFTEILQRPELTDYQILSDSESSSHYLLNIDGSFDLVTNRNSISKSAAGVFEDSGFIAEIKKFLEDAKQNIPIFSELIGRLKREQRESKLNQQIEILDESKKTLSSRERFRIPDSVTGELFVSPLPGEEYLVGVLYASLRDKVPPSNQHEDYWRKIFTFSTLGIDSIGSKMSSSLQSKDLVSVEYKYEFSNSGPFNHALSIVDYIVAWNVKLSDGDDISDDYDCFGKVVKISDGVFNIIDIEDKAGSTYNSHSITVINLRSLIKETWPNMAFSAPPKANLTNSKKKK